MMNASDVISKIKKCFALAESTNQHEAAAALRQAHALMRKFAISEIDVAIHEIKEARIHSRVQRRPPNWEENLAAIVSTAFQCRSYFASGVGRQSKGEWVFIGRETSIQVAVYAFEVLLRKLTSQRQAFIRCLPSRNSPYLKTRRGDLFCRGWIDTVRQQIVDLVDDDKDIDRAITTYVSQRYDTTNTLDVKDRNKRNSLRHHDLLAIQKGTLAGREVSLHKPLFGTTRSMLTEKEC